MLRFSAGIAYCPLAISSCPIAFNPCSPKTPGPRVESFLGGDRGGVAQVALGGGDVKIVGMCGDALRLKMLTEQKPQSRQTTEAVYCKGWFIGSKTEKDRLVEDMLVKNLDIHWAGGNYKDFELMRAERIVREGLRRLKLSEEDVKNARKSAEWRIEIAKEIRHLTTAPNSWIANRLKMGHPNYVSNLISQSDEKS